MDSVTPLGITDISAFNLAFKEWGSVFPGAARVVALVDRFTQHCHVIDVDGESWRQRPDQDPDSSAPVARPKKKRRAG